MTFTTNEVKLLEKVINQGFFDDAPNTEEKPFIGYLSDCTNKQKGILGSLCKKNILFVVEEIVHENMETKRYSDIYQYEGIKQSFIDNYLFDDNGWWKIKKELIK